jgi:MFS family permease
MASGGTPPPQDEAGTFAALSVPAFRYVWVATLLYFLAIFAQMIARGWLAHELTASNAGLGAVNLAYGVVSLLCTPIGGVMADRLNRRRVTLVAVGGMGILALLLTVAVSTERLTYWMLLVASGAEAVIFAFVVPARMALTVELVGRDLLRNAVALSQISMNVNRILGPFVAGVLMAAAWSGPAGVYLLGTVVCVIAVGCVARVPRTAGLPRERPARSARAELAGGVAYVRRTPPLGRLLVVSTVVTMFGFSYVTFLPAVSEDFFAQGANGYAWLSALGAVGGLATSVLIAGRFGARHGHRIQVVSGVGFALGVAALGLAPSFELALLAAVGLGAAVAGFQSMNATLVMAAADPAFHGRMQSMLQLGFSAFGLAALPLGLLADTIGLRQTLVLMGAACGLTILTAELWPNRRPAPAAGRAPTVGPA